MYTLFYRKGIVIVMTILGLGMFIISSLYFLGFNFPFNSSPYFPLIFGFVIVALLPWSVYNSGKKNFSSHGMLQEKIIYEFTDEKIKITGESFSSELDWAKFYKIVELKQWILFYQNKQIANILPKEAFGEDIDAFRRLVKSTGVKAKLK